MGLPIPKVHFLEGRLVLIYLCNRQLGYRWVSSVSKHSLGSEPSTHLGDDNIHARTHGSER